MRRCSYVYRPQELLPFCDLQTPYTDVSSHSTFGQFSGAFFHCCERTAEATKLYHIPLKSSCNALSVSENLVFLCSIVFE